MNIPDEILDLFSKTVDIWYINDYDMPYYLSFIRKYGRGIREQLFAEWLIERGLLK